jgi:uncharacterized membrane protein YdfJ with MMPL/SSD domain
MGTVLHRLGAFAARRPWVVLAAWVLLLAGVIGAVRTFGSETSNDLELPGTGSQEVQDLLAERFPPQQNGTNPIVFHVDSGKLTDEANKSAVTSSVKAMREEPHVHSVTNPLSDSGQTAGLLSQDGRTAFAPVLLDVGSGALTLEIAQGVMDAADPADEAGIQVAAAGSIGSELSKDTSESSEVVGILAAMFILTLVLGSLIAMGLPIIAAVAGLATSLAVVGLLGHAMSMPDTASTIATMIGLGVGIDYALFLISRHQEQLATGMPVQESIARAVATSGSAIVFAGGTVVVALLSLRVAGIPLMSTLGLASAVAVVTAVLAAITLLPAVLGLLKHRIHWARLPRLRRGGGGPAAAGAGGLWASWSGFVSRHPVAVTLVSLALVLPLVLPAFSLRFGQEDIGATPTSTTERQAYDLITAGFGVGYNGPLQVASRFDPVLTPSEEYTSKYNEAMSLKSELDKSQKQLPQEKKQLEAQQQELEKEQRQLETEGDDLKSEQAQLEDEGGELETEEEQLEADEADLKREQASLERQAAALKRQSAQLRAEGAQLQQEKRAMQAEKSRLERERDQLRAQAQEVAQQIRRVGEALAFNLARQELLEELIADAPTPAVRERRENRLARVQAHETELRGRLARLETQAESLAARARRLEAQAASLDRQAAQLERQADQLEAQKRQLQTQGDELKKEKASLERQAAALRTQADELSGEGDALQDEGSTLQAEGDQLQAEGDQLQKQGDSLQKQADELTAEKQQAQQEQKRAEKLQKQLTAMMTAAGGDPRNTDPRVVRLQDSLSGTAGVADLTPPQTNEKGDVMLLSAVPTSGPATEKTTELLADVRDIVLPGLENQGGMTSYVGGYTASYVDLATLISQRLLLVIGTVILLGFLLLMIAFRSLLVPLQAALTNLLSAAAAFGVLTATFQWGWGISLVGIDTASSSVPIASYVPLMMFAVLFGLSMDYEVFLVSHVQQHHLEGQAARQAVASGLRSSARITTAACLIMTSVFASFILTGDPTIKQFGVGLAAAVLLAGVLVVTLAPAVITLMGNAAWWLPRWLDRVLPHMNIEGEAPTVPAEEAVLPDVVVPAVYLPGQRTEPEEEQEPSTGYSSGHG